MEILKILGQVAGIGGIALGVLLLLFRDVIRKNIFAKLTKSHSYQLLRLTLILVWSVALVGIITYAWIERFNGSDGSVSHRAEIELIDVVVSHEDIASNIVDVKVKNAGDGIAFIKKAVFSVTEFQEIEYCDEFLVTFGHVPPSHTYTVTLPATPPSLPYTIENDLSQSVDANDVDRFQFRIGRANGNIGWTIYRLHIEILYDTGDQNKVETDVILSAGTFSGFSIRTLEDEIEWYGSVVSDPSFISSQTSVECLQKNFENIRAMLDLPGIRSREIANMKVKLEQLQAELTQALDG